MYKRFKRFSHIYVCMDTIVLSLTVLYYVLYIRTYTVLYDVGLLRSSTPSLAVVSLGIFYSFSTFLFDSDAQTQLCRLQVVTNYSVHAIPCALFHNIPKLKVNSQSYPTLELVAERRKVGAFHFPNPS